MECFSFQLGMRLSEIGPLYDRPNESVILLVENVAACRIRSKHPRRGRFGAAGLRRRPNGAERLVERLLPPRRSGAIMNGE